jgi:hypothetical protein
MSTVARKRPFILSVVIIFSMIGCFFALMASIMPAVKKQGEFYPALLGLLVALRFISLVAVWYMKRWGVHFFCYALLLRVLLYIIMGDISLFGGLHIFFSLVYIGLFFGFYKRMDRNL